MSGSAPALPLWGQRRLEQHDQWVRSSMVRRMAVQMVQLARGKEQKDDWRAEAKRRL